MQIYGHWAEYTFKHYQHTSKTTKSRHKQKLPLGAQIYKDLKYFCLIISLYIRTAEVEEERIRIAMAAHIRRRWFSDEVYLVKSEYDLSNHSDGEHVNFQNQLTMNVHRLNDKRCIHLDARAA